MSRNFVVTLVALAFSTVSAYGQATGRLTGSVTDPSGAGVPNAIVDLLLKDGTKPILSTTTTPEGLFSMTGIRVGAYQIAVTATSFAVYHADRVVIDASRETSLNAIKLSLASSSQTVQVTEDIETLQTANAEASTTITTKQISRLPILDRDVVSLVSTQPGVADNGSGETVINGQRSSFSNVTLDGINIQDNFIRTGGLDYQPNRLLMDQVSEVTIVSSNGNATLGGGSSQVNLVTPSGTNQLHGKAYWYNRNNYFAANTWFDNKDGNPRPFLNQNQVGASIGGPIKRDKLFFYFNYEAVRTRQQFEANETILTATARQGIFSYIDSRDGKTVRQLNVLTAAGAKADTAMAAQLALLPGPEKINNFRTGDSQPGILLNTAGYSFNQRGNEDRNNITGRIDYTFSTKHNFSATYAYNNDRLDRGDAATNYDVVPDIFNDNAAKLLSFGWRWNPIPSMTNEFRAGFNLSPGVFASKTNYPSYFVDGASWSNPVNEFLPQGRFTDTFSINDNATWVHARHTFQAGFQSQKIKVNVYDYGGTIPDFFVATGNGHAGLAARNFTNITQADLDNANTLLASLGGFLDNGGQLYNVTSKTSGYVPGALFRRHYSVSNYSGYVLDTWKAWPKFTITLGLRYEYFTPTTEADTLGLMPTLKNANPITTLLDPAGSLNFAGSGSTPFYNARKTNFAPNIGFAWDVFGNGTTALRGGYSLHYVNDEAIRSVDNNTNTNNGLVGSRTVQGLKNFAAAPPVLAAPAFQVPITYADNYAADSTSALGLINPNLKTPYVQEYRISLQQKIKGTIVEAGYVGNHGVQMLRAFDFNQVQINSHGFLADFRRAQNNGFLAQARTGTFAPAYNATIPGSQPLTVFPLLTSNGYISGRNADATVLQYIAEGQVAQLSTYYQVNGINGSVNFFQNPNALGTNYLTNFSNSSYNALQLNVSHRVDSGLYVQANYTFARVLSDADGNTQERFDPFLDVNNGSLERSRAPFDIMHVFHLNVSYDLPVGKGHRFSTGRVLDRVFSGWSVSTIVTYQSGTPFSVLSALGTFNRGTGAGGRSRYNTATSILGGDALNNIVKFQMTGDGPTNVVASAINPANGGRGVADFGDPAFKGQVFYNPVAGTVGALQRRMFTGPNLFDMNASLIKNTRITEKQSLEFRVDSFNVLNHPSFAASDQYINSTTFGLITGTSVDRRVVQFGLNYQF